MCLNLENYLNPLNYIMVHMDQSKCKAGLVNLQIAGLIKYFSRAYKFYKYFINMPTQQNIKY
jgi:hypothetical protein